jgi:hypothetical protein
MAQVAFALSPVGKLEAAAQSKFAFTTQWAAIIVTTIGSLRVTSGSFNLLALVDNDNARIRYSRSFPNLSFGYGTTSGGTSATICSFDFSAMSDADEIAISFRYTAATNPTHDLFCTVTRLDGTQLATGSIRYGDVTLPGTSSIIRLWDNAVAGSLLGAAVFSAAPASNYLNPSSDPNLVALYYMDDDGTGKVKDWVSGGTSLTATNATLNGLTDAWDPITATTVPAFGRFGVRGPVR